MARAEASPESRRKSQGEKKEIPRESLYIAGIDWGVRGEKMVPSAEGDFAFVQPFIFKNSPDAAPVMTLVSNDHEAPSTTDKVGQKLAEVIRQGFSEQLGIPAKDLQFKTLENFLLNLNDYLRHEIGYALMVLANDTEESSGSTEFREALWNTGHMFLLSLGIKWHLKEKELQAAEKMYHQHFEGILGPMPKKFETGGIHGVRSQLGMINYQLELMHDAMGLKISQEWDELAELGHGFTYVLQQVAKRGGMTQIVHGPRAFEPKATPVGATWFSLSLKK